MNCSVRVLRQECALYVRFQPAQEVSYGLFLLIKCSMFADYWSHVYINTRPEHPHTVIHK